MPRPKPIGEGLKTCSNTSRPFKLMSAGSTAQRSAQVSRSAPNGRLAPAWRHYPLPARQTGTLPAAYFAWATYILSKTDIPLFYSIKYVGQPYFLTLLLTCLRSLTPCRSDLESTRGHDDCLSCIKTGSLFNLQARSLPLDKGG
jgi:hypothetical protein